MPASCRNTAGDRNGQSPAISINSGSYAPHTCTEITHPHRHWDFDVDLLLYMCPKNISIKTHSGGTVGKLATFTAASTLAVLPLSINRAFWPLVATGRGMWSMAIESPLTFPSLRMSSSHHGSTTPSLASSTRSWHGVGVSVGRVRS